ncbi:MAG TPA: ParB/RepB/Spo0J family partition protein [Bacteroidales bacterium]
MKKLALENIGVKNIALDELIPNPHNPRVLFDRVPLNILRESIKKVGILVPLTVYLNKGKNKYIILDGQRRWMCAKELQLKEVPANQVAEPSLVQNIVTMFQIHKLRADWELMPTALKLEVLISELEENNDKKLATLTGLDQAVVIRCKKLLSYPKKYQDKMLEPDPQNRIKADFFIELYPVLHDRFIIKQKWFKKNDFTDRMLDKYLNGDGAIKSVTDFRLVKQYINNAVKANKEIQLNEKLYEFVNNKTIPVEYLKISEADIATFERKFLTEINKIESLLIELNCENFYGEEPIWLSLEKLLKTIEKKLQEAGRRSNK